MKNSIAKPPAFMIAENPMISADDGRLFVLHARNPYLLAEVFEYGIDDERGVAECMEGFSTSSKLNYGNDIIVFGLCYLEANTAFEQKTPNQQLEKIVGIMNRMADWYKAYLIWNDNRIE
jgi:hypothetical protein